MKLEIFVLRITFRSIAVTSIPIRRTIVSKRHSSTIPESKQREDFFTTESRIQLRGKRTHSDTKSTQMLPVFLLRLSREHLSEESDTVQCQIERIDMMLCEIYRDDVDVSVSGRNTERRGRTGDSQSTIPRLLTSTRR